MWMFCLMCQQVEKKYVGHFPLCHFLLPTAVGVFLVWFWSFFVGGEGGLQRKTVSCVYEWNRCDTQMQTCCNPRGRFTGQYHDMTWYGWAKPKMDYTRHVIIITFFSVSKDLFPVWLLESCKQAKIEVDVLRNGTKLHIHQSTPSDHMLFCSFPCRPSWFKTSTAIPRTVHRRPTLLAVSSAFVSNLLFCFLNAVLVYNNRCEVPLQPR